jgi:polyisoprenyl-phosphate glycosyltransferase
MYTVVIPVYRNSESLPELLATLSGVSKSIHEQFAAALEVVFVVDSSPDRSFDLLCEMLPRAPFKSQLLLHARNFGAFAAIRTGLIAGTGPYYGMIAADLQEPPELLIEFLKELVSENSDIVLGVRKNRNDPTVSKLLANGFWRMYRSVVMPEIPKGGLDLFGCNRRVRDELVALEEANSSLVGLVCWLGFRKKQVVYERRPRKHGKSAWSFRKKLKYLIDSVFAFTDLPIRVLSIFGIFGVTVSVVFGVVVLLLKLFAGIETPGYAATILTIMFFGALNMMGLGIVGAYAWRCYENTKRRPLALVQEYRNYEGMGNPRIDNFERGGNRTIRGSNGADTIEHRRGAPLGAGTSAGDAL